MSKDSPVITWECKKQENFYLLICKRGEVELFEIIHRKQLSRIDRVLIVKRAIENMARLMHAVISSANA